MKTLINRRQRRRLVPSSPGQNIRYQENLSGKRFHSGGAGGKIALSSHFPAKIRKRIIRIVKLGTLRKCEWKNVAVISGVTGSILPWANPFASIACLVSKGIFDRRFSCNNSYHVSRSKNSGGIFIWPYLRLYCFSPHARRGKKNKACLAYSTVILR